MSRERKSVFTPRKKGKAQQARDEFEARVSIARIDEKIKVRRKRLTDFAKKSAERFNERGF